jgi:multidrug efflux pump subunit AcrA (membrane-fusion protein)
VLKFLVEKQNKLEIEQANLRKLYAQHKSNIEGQKAELVSSEAVLNLFKIQLEKSKFESEKKKEIKTLEFERQLVKYNKVEKKYKLTQKVLENELKIQQIKIFQLENDVNDAKQALKQLTVLSPLNGMMQLLENRRTRQIAKVGDELHQSQKFACVPDLSKMKVISTVNETDIGKIYLTQKVVVRLDAFPSIPFEGEIMEIGRLSYKKDKTSQSKIFDIVINLYKSDPILKPGMTVRCEIFTAHLNDVFYVENECVIKENMKYYMFMENNGNGEKCEVKIGPRNTQYTVVYGEYKKGQSVIPLYELEKNKITNSDI